MDAIQRNWKQIFVSPLPDSVHLLGIFYFTKMAKEIQLTQGKVALVDDDMFDYLNQWKWFAAKNHNNFYAVTNWKIFKGKQHRIFMHRLIMNPEKGMIIDHLDRCGLNNQKNNLRICTKCENSRNRGLNLNNKTGFKGVYYIKFLNKYRVQIQSNKIKYHLGYFIDIKEAINTYNEAAIKFHKEFANLNKID